MSRRAAGTTDARALDDIIHIVSDVVIVGIRLTCEVIMAPVLTAVSDELLSEEVIVTVRVPRGLSHESIPSLIDALEAALMLLSKTRKGGHVIERADLLARLAEEMVEPSIELIDDRLQRLRTVNRILSDTEWLTSDQINALQQKRPANNSLPASDWKRRGRIFSVNYGGKEMFPRYEFDATYQPLPVIKEILTAFGDVADPWTLAAWFHFPNRWLANRGAKGMDAVAPKDALDAGAAVVNAASKRLNGYVA